MDTVAFWNYTDRVDEDRRALLAAPGSFEDMVRFVNDDARVTEVRAERGRSDELTHCLQPVFTLELPNAGDPVFNGPRGYRAQYWVSAGNGLAANTALLTALTPKLLGQLDTRATP